MNVNGIGNALQSFQRANVEAQVERPSPGAAAGATPQASTSASALQKQAAAAGEPHKEELKETVKTINDFVKSFSDRLEFSIDQDSGRTVVKLVDTENKQVLRQYPTREALAIARDIENFQGHLLKTEA
jgi:flagellar protein FlaG